MSGSTWTWIGGTINLDSPTDWALTSGPGNAADIPQTGDTAINTGTLVGVGVIAASVINNGTIEASNNSVASASTGGVLEITGGISGTGSMTIAPGATLRVDSVLGSSQAIAFNSGAPETLILGSPAAVTTNTITGLALGDQIEISNGVTITGGAVVSGGTTTIPYKNANGTTGTYQFTNLGYAAGTSTSFEFGFDFATGVQNEALTRFFTWTGTTSTTFGVASNWSGSFGVAPGPFDFATFSSGGGTIAGSGSVFVLDFRGGANWTLAAGTALSDTGSFQLGRNGIGSTSLSVGATTTISSSGFIDIAQAAGNNDLLSITGGGVVRQTGPGVTYTNAMQIGNGGTSGTLAPADGLVLVSGAGSLLNLGANGLSVAANGGIGNLTVQQGATVDAATPNSSLNASVLIANSAGDGSILVTGTGSVLNATGYFLDGRGGTGALTIQSGGSVVITDAALNGSGMGIGAGRSAGPSSTTTYGGNGVATVTEGGVLDVNSTVSGITVGGNGVNGELSVGSSGTVLAGTGIVVGTATTANGTIYGGTGALNIGAGGLVKVGIAAQTVNYGVQIGSDNSSFNGLPTNQASGDAIISGTDAKLDTNGNPLGIGVLSDGVMVVSSGGSVVTGSLNDNVFAALTVGRTGNGSLTISDAESSVTANGGMFVGRAGTGALLVENQGSLAVQADAGGGSGYLDIGNAGLTNGNTLLVGGSGAAQVTTGGSVFAQGTITVGSNGNSGSLAIDKGGVVTAGQRLLIGTSTTIPAAGFEITTTGTTAVPNPLALSGSGIVDIGASGTLVALGNGITTAGTSDISVGFDAGSSGVLNVTGAGALVNSSGDRITVGRYGQGTMLVSQGGSVSAATGFASDDAVIVGNYAGGAGAITVTDPGSSIDATGQIVVGAAGSGSLTVQNQATVQSGGSALTPSQGIDEGQLTGSSGTIDVTGSLSLLTNTGGFLVGDASAGLLSIQSGGTVITTPGTVTGLPGLVVGNTPGATSSLVNVAGTGSQLKVTGELDVGATGSGALQLSGGAIVNTDTLDAGISSSAIANITVSGAGTELFVNESATVADDGTGVLSVLNGASFSAQSLTIGSQTDSSGALIVSGNNTTLTVSGELNIGTALGTGDLTVGPGAVVNAAVVNLQGGVVLEGGVLDPTVYIENGGSTTGGFGTIASDYILLEGTILSNGSKSGKQTEVVQGTVVGGGTATINGSVSVNSPGILQMASHDTIEVTGAVLNAASTTFTDNLTPTGTYTVNNSVIDVVFQDGTGVLKLDDIAGFDGTIATWSAGDQFVITGGTLSNLGVTNGNTLTAQDSGTGAGTGGIDQIIFGSAISSGGFTIVNGNTLQAVACFAEGTRIRTPDGDIAVEHLQVGDVVLTADGAREPIVWVGQRAIDCRSHPAPETVWPIRVQAGAFSQNVPVYDLYLSPDHAVFVNDVLVPVKLLVDGTSIAPAPRDRVRYFHVELPRHAIILAEALPVESYLDTGDRANFAGGETIRLFPDFAHRVAAATWETRGAAPLVLSGPGLTAARRAVTGRAPRFSEKSRPAPARGYVGQSRRS